jgi:dihydroorotase
MSPIVFRNVRLGATGPTADLLAVEGRIEAAGAGLRVPSGTTEVDGAGLVLAPGLVDIHVHLREPGQEDKETIATGTRAAAAGGFTAVACMPNTVPPLDDASRVRWVAQCARDTACCRVHPVGAVTVGQAGERLTEFLELRDAGAVAVSDDGRPVVNADLFRRALEYARHCGFPVIAHEEDLQLRGRGCMNEGYTSTRLGLKGIPNAAEAVMVRRDVELAALTRGRLHVAHVSCAESVEALRDAKARGLAVTGETAPHYVALTDEAVGWYDTNAKMNPPLRAPRDRDAVIEALRDCTLDCLATDHAPHTPSEKAVEFDQAPMGVVGLETALGVTLKYLVEPGHLALERALELWTAAPRRVLGLPELRLEAGYPADLVLLDPEVEWTVDPAAFFTKGRNTPFAGMRLRGRALLTLCGGRVTHLDPGAQWRVSGEGGAGASAAGPQRVTGAGRAAAGSRLARAAGTS